MGGFTQIKLRDCSQRNIDTQNARLEVAGVPKVFRFYSERDTILEYEYFRAGKGSFPEDQFPKDKIKSLEDFKMFWSSKALGEIFVPPVGTLQFDCYFGRTSKRALRKLGRYVALNIREFKELDGSFSTFMERGMTKLEQQVIDESGLSY